MPQVAAAHLVLLTLLAATCATGLLVPKTAPSGRRAAQFLTPSDVTTDVANISAADCAAARLRDPSVVCGNGSTSLAVSAFVGPISPVNYPHFSDPLCNAAGGFLCDPGTDHTAMTAAERATLAQRLVALRNQDASLVVCGAPQRDSVDPWHYQPFYLGVAVLPDWPAARSDDATLGAMGELILADWNMDELFVGEPAPAMRCPTEALLLIAPRSGEVFLSSPSCDFVCATKGGGEVAARARAALRGDGPQGRRVLAAATAGGEELYRQLARRRGNATGALAPKEAAAELNLSNFLQRLIFGLVMLALVAASAVGLAVLLLGPGLISRRGKLEC